MTVAAGASQLAAKTLLIEKEKELGGDCLHFGCVPSKTLIKTAHVYHQMRNSRHFGLPGVELSPVDFKEVVKRIKSVISQIQRHDSVERFCRLGAKVEIGIPVFSDEHSIWLNEKLARAAGVEYSVWTEAFKDNDRSLAEGEKIGKIKMILDQKEKPIGVQILGPHAGELIGEWIAVLNGNVKLSTLASSVHPYPTLIEINKKVAGTFFSPKIFSEKVKKGLKFFFQLKGRACSKEDLVCR